jgi:glucose-1-phosphate cytidylyltransferase
MGDRMLKVVILAGGAGTRLMEETETRPKPMVDIGGKPILWHIMKHYASYGFSNFFIALGYKGEAIKRYFLDHYALSGSFTINLSTGDVQQHEKESEPWTANLIDTGESTQTGGRLGRLREWLSDETFMLTYGDGLSDVDLKSLLECHKSSGRIATLTAVRPAARFGALDLDGSGVAHFREKSQTDAGWINGGFMVFEPVVFDFIESDATVLEAHVLERLAEENQLSAYRHEGFWQSMDTLRDKRLLDSLWQSGEAPWKTWH